ncbi:soluble calcium-activated nucleotidase 1-like isoform X2 [Daktulosphaira vitifoliae]|uniref:soluble calcium-activated nucleotidase 1-like isoform X1 n=1 Tax=Daktulosphaira vitifoliae TaxID=58002 RepID=UPI0021A98A12|nr:soluble calcium-activated nucleotidase 1-like isoform X1 [Daktulosphaira vitifoliae]XP_050538782.1 soluble calcium-activated nucleotidase 1-like isoform X2 [Daktulosphaira vitifoliae]
MTRLLGILLLVVISIQTILGAPTKVEKPSSICNRIEEINTTYPLTSPIKGADGSIEYRIALIADLDSDSKSSKEALTWISYLKKGYLKFKKAGQKVEFKWDKGDDSRFTSNFAIKDRGLELSELVTFDGKLLTIDDKTGIIYVVENENTLIPWVIVNEGNGRSVSGFKNEWATVKDSKLYVGTHGRELDTKNGVNYSGMWIKIINAEGSVKHVDWTDNYVKVRAAAGIKYPGYMTHEAAVWSDIHKKFFFLPRKASPEKYNFKDDEKKGTNYLISATADFKDIKSVKIGEIVPSHGYASFKFVPDTNDQVIAAIKSEEVGETTGTFITAFNIDGKILYPETKVSDLKFEGFEFI